MKRTIIAVILVVTLCCTSAAMKGEQRRLALHENNNNNNNKHDRSRRRLYAEAPSKESSPKAKSGGGLLRGIGQVWIDASSVKTSTLVSKCIKPPKKSNKGSKYDNTNPSGVGEEGITTSDFTVSSSKGGKGKGGGGSYYNNNYNIPNSVEVVTTSTTSPSSVQEEVTTTTTSPNNSVETTTTVPNTVETTTIPNSVNTTTTTTASPNSIIETTTTATASPNSVGTSAPNNVQEEQIPVAGSATFTITSSSKGGKGSSKGYYYDSETNPLGLPLCEENEEEIINPEEEENTTDPLEEPVITPTLSPGVSTGSDPPTTASSPTQSPGYSTTTTTQSPGYSSSTTQSPGYSTTTTSPIYSTPTTASPGYSTPTSPSPGYSTPTTQSPGYSTPTTQSPGYSTPTAQSPIYSTPTTQSPIYSTPTTQSPGSSTTTTTTTSPMSYIPVITSPTPSPTEPRIVAQQAVCDSFFDGTAPKGDNVPRLDYTTKITWTIENGYDEEPIFEQIGDILNKEIAPFLIGCTDTSRQRLLSLSHRQVQNNLTELVNLYFTTPQRDTEGTCTETSTDTYCAPTITKSDLYYYGVEPTDFDEKILQAILFWNFDIEGLGGFEDIDVIQTEDDGRDDVTAQDVDDINTSSNNNDGTNRDVPVANIEDGKDEDDDSGTRRVNPAAPITAVLAALILALLAIFVVRRRRNSDESLSKHRELTDDEDPGMETDEMMSTPATPKPYGTRASSEEDGTPSPTPYPRGDEDEIMGTPKSYGEEKSLEDSMPPALPKSYIVGEDFSLAGSGQGQEVFVASLDQQQQYANGLAPTSDYTKTPHHECSSPNCIACEAKRQQGIKFVMADTGIEHAPQLPPDAERSYQADDTVSL